MNPSESGSSDGHAPRGDYFVTTRWTVVISAGQAESPDSQRALGELCQAYWYPLYTYVRRHGRTKEDAEDLVQAFFSRFLEKNYLEGLRADRGKFRAFLLAALKHFLANEWDRARRQKRGGGALHLSLDWQDADDRYHLEPVDPASPDRAYDRAWALALLEQVIRRLREECTAAGKAELFAQAHGYLSVGEKNIRWADAAAALGMEEGAVRVAMHRLRARYRELLREEIGQTLHEPAQLAEELRSLQAALSSSPAG